MPATQISGQLGSARLGLFNLGSPGPRTIQQARIDSFTVDNIGPVFPGATVNLSWATKFASTITLSGIGAVGASGSQAVNPTVTTTYTLTASDGVNPVQTQSITVLVISPASFKRAAQGGPVVSNTISCNIQLDIGDLVVVAACSNTANINNDMTVSDNLGNVYELDVQGATGTFDSSPANSVHAGTLALFSTVVTVAGMATITNTSGPNDMIGIMVCTYSIPTGMKFAQGAKMIGDSAPDPIQTFGTAAYNCANSLILTIIIEGFNVLHTSLDGDTSRVQIPGFAIAGHGGYSSAMFDAIVAGVPGGARNSNIQDTALLGSSGFGAPNILVAVYSAPLPRPLGLNNQAAVRPSLGSNIQGYAGQPNVDVSLPYLPQLGDLIFVAAEAFWGFAPAPIPNFSVSDNYGNIYRQLLAWQGGVLGFPPTQDAAAMFYTIVQNVPASGVFTARVIMTPVNGPGIVGIAAYSGVSLNPANFQSASLVLKTTEGSNSRIFSGQITVGAQSFLIAFVAAQQGAGNNVPTPFMATDGYSIDAHWDIAQVYITPLNSWPRMETGAWMHKVVNTGTYDGQGLAFGFQFGGITLASTPVVPPLTIACPAVLTFQVGVPFSQPIRVLGGVPPYQFSILAGSLPTGVTLNPATGVVSGTPTIQGTFPTTFRVIDSA